MKRSILIALLTLGTILGYGSEFAHMRHAMHGHCACPNGEPTGRP